MVVTGCVTVGPDYVKPDAQAPYAWHGPLKGGLAPGDSDMAAWWTTLNDPELSSLIDRALAGSLDLKKARARVREARAQKGATKEEMRGRL